jgi:hypothetical protein
MPIAKNLSHVPADKVAYLDQPPVRDPLFAQILADKWAEDYIDDEVRPTAVPCRVRHSDAGKCSRALSYKLLGLTVSEPLTEADHYRFNMGTLVHDLFQSVATTLWPGATVETVGSFGEPNEYGMVLSAGHGDLNVQLPAKDDEPLGHPRHHVELKTINGYGFQRAIGLKGNAQGPRHSAVLQASLNALADDADWMTIVYLSLDVIGAKPAEQAGLAPWQRFCAEWRYPREEFEPLARAELARFNEVVMLADEGICAERWIPDPEIPEDALITNPAKGFWTVQREGRIFNSGDTWHCGYCAYRTKCVEDLKAGT